MASPRRLPSVAVSCSSSRRSQAVATAAVMVVRNFLASFRAAFSGRGLAIVIIYMSIYIGARGDQQGCGMNWGMMTKAERDAAYNNSDAVKNSPKLNAARIAASAAFRKAHPGHLDLRYGPKERNVWDLFPAKDANAPCLVFIHGGYWQRHSRGEGATPRSAPPAPGVEAALPRHATP